MTPMEAGRDADSDLRRRAEARLADSGNRHHGDWDPDLRSMMHELQVHQVELELQFEELLRAHAETDRARRQYADLYENAPVGYLTLDDGAVIRRVNPALTDALRTTSQALLDSPFLPHVAPACRPEFLRLFDAARAAPGQRVTGRLDLDRADGRVLPCQTEARSPDGADVLMVMVDISGRLEVEEELRERAGELQRSNEDLERFAYVSSHDLQEPLRSIVSFSQLLDRRYRDRLDADADEYLGFIVEAGTRMQDLIQDLLLFSRISTCRSVLGAVESREVLHASLRDLSSSIEASGAVIEHGPLPAVMADETQLAQVFENLISNAVKFHREGVPPLVRVSAEREGELWRFAVQDNGIGIAPEYFDRIFVIFQRLHTRDRFDGTGIGLPLVKRIIDQHGGRIWVESEPGRGTTFFFTLRAA